MGLGEACEKKMKIVLSLLIAFFFTQDQLIGTWECVDKNPNSTGETNLLTGKIMADECNYILSFREDGTATSKFKGSDEEFNTQFTIKQGSILLLGNQKFIIEELTEHKLVLKDTFETWEAKLLPKTYTYKKMTPER